MLFSSFILLSKRGSASNKKALSTNLSFYRENSGKKLKELLPDTLKVSNKKHYEIRILHKLISEKIENLIPTFSEDDAKAIYYAKCLDQNLILSEIQLQRFIEIYKIQCIDRKVILKNVIFKV